jgi:tetratricopeptide (TPR) repeat protein
VQIASAALEAKFMVNLGFVDVAAPVLADAVEYLRTASDPHLYLETIESQLEALAYLGQADEVVRMSLEAIRVSEEFLDELWAVGMRNYHGMGLMMQGNLEEARLILEEAEVLLAERGEQFMRPWNLSIRSMIAMMQGRTGDAIELQERQVEIAEGAGYTRAVALALDGLGMSYIAAGNVEAANDSLLRALDLYEGIGLIVEQASVVAKIAGVRAAMGDDESAVVLLASVLADPISARQDVMSQAVIADLATATLAESQGRLEPDVYSAAQARGSVIAVPVTVKQLLADSR